MSKSKRICARCGVTFSAQTRRLCTTCRPGAGSVETCIVCNEEFVRRQAHQIYCSPLCHRRFTYVTKLRYPNCGVCGKLFTAHGYQHNTKYCSDGCRRTAIAQANKAGRERNVETSRRLARKHSSLRRARKALVVTEDFTHEQVFERDKWICHLCGKRINPTLRRPHPLAAQLDHIIPISQGGPHTLANVAASHAFCNISKSNRARSEQLRLIG